MGRYTRASSFFILSVFICFFNACISEKVKEQMNVYSKLKTEIEKDFDELTKMSRVRADKGFILLMQERLHQVKELSFTEFKSEANVREDKVDEVLENLNEFVQILKRSRDFKPNVEQLRKYEQFRDSITVNISTLETLGNLKLEPGISITPKVKIFVYNVRDNDLDDFLKLTYWSEKEFEKEFEDVERLWSMLKTSINGHGISQGIVNPNAGKWYFN